MSGYLELLDGLLRTGLEGLSPAFRQAQATYVVSQQRPDGGFPGRRGPSDLYYTDFALRLLALLDPDPVALAAAARYLAHIPAPTDVVACFNLLNCRRLLVEYGHEVQLDLHAVLDVLRGRATRGAYHTFLAALCWEMLGQTAPQAEAAVEMIAGLQGAGGGFREQAGEGVEQTNATAAAVAYLLMRDALSEQRGRAATDFLATMQAADGGFLAHPAAPGGDLLSTFTALATLAGLDAIERVDLTAVARFLRQTAAPGGGFKAAPADTEADLEYTYYGVGCLALMQAALPHAVSSST
jgi:geranylgeranyl transferase type-2 subunit beta